MSRAAKLAGRVVQIGAIAFSIIYFITGLAYLCLDHWSVTQQDFWRVYYICLNNSWLHSALYKFNGHSLFFPSFIWLADLRFFHGDQTVIFYASLLLLLASIGLLLASVWHDKSLDLSTRILATSIVIGFAFWMGRASITVASGFNCMASLVIFGMAWALRLLPQMGTPFQRWRLRSFLLVFAGYIASFSFATGLAIWPSLIFLAWCMRLPWRTMAILIVGAVSAALIFHFLPPMGDHSNLIPPDTPLAAICLEASDDFCRLVGAPILYCTAAWQGVQITTAITKSSAFLVSTGGMGVVLALVILLIYFIQRPLAGKDLEMMGLALISLNLASLFLVVAGRLVYFRENPSQIAAPRYLFWSSLFWAGLVLVTLGLSIRQRWMRPPLALLVLCLPVFGWQAHRYEGLHWRYSRLLTEQAATGLINGVYDPGQLLFREMDTVKLLTPELRARRLDMFAAGMQDWIGTKSSEVFKIKPVSKDFVGDVQVEPLSGTQEQQDAVRVTGYLRPGKRAVSHVMVILDSDGVIAGIARSFVTSRIFNSLLFANRMPQAHLCGYIRHYDPSRHYVLRSADNGVLSEQEIKIAAHSPEK